MKDGVQSTNGRNTFRSSDAFGHRLTRRNLLRGAAGLGAGAVAFGGVGSVLGAAGRWTPPVTADQHNSRVANEWMRLAIQIMPSTPGLSPNPADRVIGYLGVALYEALVPSIPGYGSLAGRLNDLTPAPGHANRALHWPSVANSALATSMRELFRMTNEDNLQAIDNLELSLETEIRRHRPPGIGRRSIARGRLVADHIMAWAATDGGHDGHMTNFPPDYTPPAGPGLWVPTPPANLNAYQPYWGMNRPMAVGPIEEFDPGPPPEFSTEPGSEFYEAELEVYEVVNALTEEQRTIALYWANPIGHHLSLTLQALEAQNADLATTAVTLARCGMAIVDSTIGSFETKYRYNMIRPITYVREHIDPEWGDPLPLPTPPHPDYTAAHAVVTGALGQALFDQFGDFPFTDHTWDAVGLAPRSFNSWSEMADEAAVSRLYGGIHTTPALDLGLEQGRQIARAVSAVIDG